MKSTLGTNQGVGQVGRSQSDFAQDVRQAAAGDPAAVRRLVIEFEPGLSQYARRRRIPEADEVVNAALSDAFRNLPTFRGTDRRAFRAYLYRILRCRIADDQRRAYSQPKRADGIDGDSEAISGLVDQSSSGFDDRVVDRQLVDEILGQLTAEQREVLEMRVLSGLTVRETADRTGRSEVAVKAMQRRALLSLRTVLAAVAGLVIVAAGIAAFVESRRPVTVVENAPADLAPDDFDGRSDPLGQNPPLVVEESAPINSSITEPTVPTGFTVSTGSTGSTGFTGGVQAGGSEAGDPTTSTPVPSSVEATAADPPPVTSPSSTESSTTGSSTGSSTGGSPPEPSFLIAPLPDGVTSSPCSVVTDGSPAVGEVAFVTYRFSGAYSLFDNTTVDIPGPQGGSTLLGTELEGAADPNAARHGDRFAFVIKGSMLRDDGFAVSSTLVDGEVTTRCKIETWAVGPPCKVIVSGPPEKGQTAKVVYNLWQRYGLLEGQQTHLLGWSKKSVLAGGGSVTFESGTRSDFTINGFMFADGPFEVRTSLADGAAHAVCLIDER